MKGTVLLLDDNPVDLKVAEAILRREGYDCSSFTDHKLALEWLKSNQARIIFLDLQMPEVSGFDLIPTINQLTKDQGTLLIIMSGHNRDVEIRRAISLGAKDYIIKPIDPLVLVDKLKKLESKNENFFEVLIQNEDFASTLIAASFQITGLSEFGVTGRSAFPLQIGEIYTLPILPPQVFPNSGAMARILSCEKRETSYECKMTFVGLSESHRQALRSFCRALWVKYKGAAS